MLNRLFRALFRPRLVPAFRSARPRLEALEDRLVPSTLFVDGNAHQKVTTPFTTIQAAINAAHAGDTIKVEPGTYRQQLNITGHGKDNLTLVADGGVIVKAPAGLNGSIVHISNVANVVFRGFTVDGGGNAAGTIDSAVRIDGGASATVRDDHLTGLFNGTGNQSGYGVRVAQASADIDDNLIDSYQKGGVIVDGAGSSATVRDNVLHGAGPTGQVAQNGIQISNGAAGEVSENWVSGNVYAGSDFIATGILVTADLNAVEVEFNAVLNNETGLVLDSVNHTRVTDNLAANNTLDGIDVFSATSVVIRGNDVESNGVNPGDNPLNSPGDGIHLENSNNNEIRFNEVRGNGGQGISLLQSAGNTLGRNDLSRNGGGGILLDTSNQNIVYGNTAVGNQGDGIALQNSSFNTLWSNFARGNGGLALRIDAQSQNTVVFSSWGDFDGKLNDWSRFGRWR